MLWKRLNCKSLKPSAVALIQTVGVQGGLEVDDAHDVTVEPAGFLLTRSLGYLVLRRVRLPVAVPLLAIHAVEDHVRHNKVLVFSEGRARGDDA